MFTWLSSYNYDYALASIPIQVILLVLYCVRRNLPIRSSSCFLLLMVSNLVLIATDIAGCETLTVWDQIPLWVTYVVNILYFLAFIARDWFLFDYIATECHGYRLFGKRTRMLAAIPALLLSAIVLSTPWTHTIFSVEPPDGYQNLGWYDLIYVVRYFYLAASTLVVLHGFREAPRREVVGFLACNATLVLGTFVRQYFMHTLVDSYFSLLAIVVIYLTAENPDLFRNRKTHLFNRDAFTKIADEHVSLRNPFCCTTIAIQNYESARALYGSAQLGRGIRLVGEWLVEHFVDHYAFYWGNGNFLLLREHVESDDWQRIFADLDARFERQWEDEETQVSLSYAACAMPHDILPNNTQEMHQVLNHTYASAHAHLTSAHAVADKTLMETLSRRQQVQNALVQALEQRRIEVYLQPIYSAREQRVVGAEALARLRDPELGFISPGEFIAVAEQNGDIIELGHQIFERVCEFLAAHDVSQWGIERINVNLSPAQCLDEGLAQAFTATADAYGIALSMFDFEVTETSFGDHSAIQVQLMSLQERGAEFSLDDFGTGVSNLTRLMELPVHVVKLDVGVVQSYFLGRLSILPDLVRMLHNASMKTVLEGVETLEMKERLEEMGCDYEQGYYFSRPLPPHEFVTYLQQTA